MNKTMLDQKKWGSRSRYADLPARCVKEATDLVLMLRGPCVVEAFAHSDEGFLLTSMRAYEEQSENFGRIRDDYLSTVVPTEQQTQHKILFIHGFYEQMLMAQRETFLESSDHWCRWRDKSETLYQAREIAHLTDEFGVDMAVNWFEGVFS